VDYATTSGTTSINDDRQAQPQGQGGFLSGLLGGATGQSGEQSGGRPTKQEFRKDGKITTLNS